MPQLTLRHATIADVLPDENDPQCRTVKINVNEEDFFEMLDHVNPKNLIKYLDMRQIPHREAINITVKRVEVDIQKRKVHKNMRQMLESNDRRVNRAQQLMEKYYGH